MLKMEKATWPSVFALYLQGLHAIFESDVFTILIKPAFLLCTVPIIFVYKYEYNFFFLIQNYLQHLFFS